MKSNWAWETTTMMPSSHSRSRPRRVESGISSQRSIGDMSSTACKTSSSMALTCQRKLELSSNRSKKKSEILRESLPRI
jgi:hypothetical protein